MDRNEHQMYFHQNCFSEGMRCIERFFVKDNSRMLNADEGDS